MMPRTKFYVALGQLARDRGVRVNYGKKFVNATLTASGRVQDRFVDGTTAVGDLLMGCDGIHSHVRKIVPKPDTPLRAGSQ